jgi:hypothetical protein
MAKQTTTTKNDTGLSKQGKTGEKIPQHSRKKRKTPKEVMSEHIADEDHVITEEEFKNLATGSDMEIEKDTAHEPLEIDDKKDRPKDEDKDPKIVTPWDVIN